MCETHVIETAWNYILTMPMRIHKKCEHLNFNVKFLLNVGKMFEKKLLMPCFTVEGLETLVCTAIFLFAAVQAIDLPCTHTQDIAWSSHGKWSHCLSGDARTPWVWPLCGWRGLSCETAETSSFFPALLWFCVNFCIFALSPMSWMKSCWFFCGSRWTLVVHFSFASHGDCRHRLWFNRFIYCNSDILWSLQLRMLPLLRAAILKLILKTRRILIRRGSWTAAVESALVSSGQVACTMNQVGVL